MATAQHQPPGRVCFAGYELDLRTLELHRQGRKVRIEGQPLQILAQLLQAPGELVSRAELIARIWPDSHVDFNHSLNAAVRRLRRALHDPARHPKFIETLPRRGYRFIAPLNHASAAPPTAGQPGIHVLAVLPLAHANTNPETEYLCDGITDGIINNLARSPGLRVISRESTFRYKCNRPDAVTIARRLNADAVLCGRVSLRGQRLVLSAELVDPNGWQLWGDRYQFAASDAPTLENSIATQIAEKLHLHLNRQSPAPHNPGKRDFSAYRAYLKGLYLRHKIDEDSLKASIVCFEQALHSDPDYASAAAALADACCLLAFFDLQPPAHLLARASEAAAKAVSLDPRLPAAHAALGSVATLYHRHFDTAAKHYLRALELNPSFAEVRRMYAALLSATGNHAGAMREIHLAQDLDPLSLIVGVDAAWHLYMAHQFQLSAEQALRVLEIEPEFPAARQGLGLAYQQCGRLDEAVAEFQHVLKTVPHAGVMASLANALAQCGRGGEAAAIAAELLRGSPARYVPPYWQAIVHAGLGAYEDALATLQRSLSTSDVWLIWLARDPRFRCLHADPRFHQIVRAAGLPSS
jgi:TolB-like protein/Flp pilus assembly protein TadD